MDDIGEKLYELIQAEFELLTARDVQLIGLSARIERGMATTRDISEYSLRLGTHLRTAIEHNVSADVLPNGRMYYNIADKILDQSLRNNYELVNDVAVRIQEAVDKKQDIHIRPQKAEYPAERVRAAVGAASAPDIDEEKMIRRMGSPAENITAGFADDYMQVNAEFRSKAGMQAYIIRDDHSGCCQWCSKQAGKYAYPDDVPQDVYRRHDNCKCTVEYVTNGRKQNVHTKQQSMISPEDRERMAELSEKGSVRLSPEEAAEAENKALEVMAQKSGKMLTDGANGGIIASDARFNMDPAKIEKFLLLPGAKHSKEFFDVGYAPNDGQKLYNDISSQFNIDNAVGYRINPSGNTGFSIFMELGITSKKTFRTTWEDDPISGKPRFTSAYRDKE